MKKTVKAFIVLTPQEPPFGDGGFPATVARAYAVYPVSGVAREDFTTFPIVPCTITYEVPDKKEV